MTENGKVAAEVAEQVVEGTVEAAAEPADRRPWLHPDALRPRDYIRGQTALKDVLAELDFETCYEFLVGPYAYPWMMWALESRTDPSFTWEQALDRDFRHYRMGADERPQILPLEPSGRSGSTPNVSGSTRRRPRPATAPSSSPSSG